MLAIKCKEPLWVLTNRGPLELPAGEIPSASDANAWTPLSAGEGSKGPRWDDWVRIALRPLAIHPAQPDQFGRTDLLCLLRACRDDSGGTGAGHGDAQGD